MKQLYIIIKNNFINNIGINKLFKGKKGKILSYGVLILLSTVSLLSISAFYAWNIAEVLKKFNIINIMLPTVFVIASLTAFIFTIYNSKGSLFNANDNDMLLSMPIKSSVVLASRLLGIILWNLVTTMFIVGPAIVIYAIKVDVSYSYYFFAFFVFILLPVIPSIIASLIGYFIAYFTAKSNSKNWFEIVISFTLVVAISFLSSYAQRILNYVINDMNTVEKILKWGFYPVYLVYEIFTDGNYISLLFFVVINVVLAFIFVIILSKNFASIIGKLQENKTRSNYVMKKMKSKSINKALFIKELKRYFSSPVYVLNTSFGVIVLLALAIGSIFYDKTMLLTMLGMNMPSVELFHILILLIAFVAVMTNTASASISLEGKNFWIVKSLPVRPIDILNSKLLLNLFVILPIAFLSIILLKFTFALLLGEMFLLILFSTLFSLVFSQFGLLINLLFPKMDALNDVVVVKRSLSVVLAVIVPFILVFGLVSLYNEISSNITFNGFITVVIIIFTLLMFLERILLNTWGSKKFKEID